MERQMAYFSERGAKSPTKEEILRSSERPGGDEVGWREVQIETLRGSTTLILKGTEGQKVTP